MTSLLSNIFAFRSTNSVRVPPVSIHDIEDAVEKPTRTLKHLLKLNHLNHSLRIRLHTPGPRTSYNNVAHHLTSAFLFGANDAELTYLYEIDSKSLDPWSDSPGEVIGSDWMDYLGKQEYERAFLDLFEDNLVDEGYEWKAVLHKYLYTGSQPLIGSITAGFGQPLLHLGLAIQMSSRSLAMETLTLVATHYHDNDVSKHFDMPAFFQSKLSSSYKSSSILEILETVRKDTNFNNPSFTKPGEHNIKVIFRDHEGELLNHWNAWITSSTDLTKKFRESQADAVALFLGAKMAKENNHDIYLLRPLLMTHALRIILPQTPDKFHIQLLQQWWLATLSTYIAQLRPEIGSQEVIKAYDVRGRDWNWISQQAVKGPHAVDTHFVQTLHALKEMGETWGDVDNYYLKAAVKFIDDFNGWDSSA